MEINYQHNLTSRETYKRINSILPELQKQYADKISNPQISWNTSRTQMDFSVDIMGSKACGHVFLEDGQITLEGELPFIARMFSEEIESMILEQLDDLLSD